MSTRRPRPNLLDVARQAGVSPATVSRVLNNTAPVSRTFKLRVLAALKSLDYEPPVPRPASSATIAVILPDILNPFFTEFCRGVQDEAWARGSTPLLLDTLEDPQREEQALRLCAARAVSGIIVCASRLPTPALIELYERAKIPMVVINRRIDHPEIPCVLVDFANATLRATRHLLALNHRRIAYFPGPSVSEPSLARRKGIERALSEVGLSLRPEWCPHSLPNVDGGFQAMSALLSLSPEDRPTGVIAYNDIMALGALQAVRVHHQRVPEDISIVGVDDIAMACHANPPLTTISQPKYKMGRVAMRILHEIMQGQKTLGDGYTLLESPLIVRESTGPAPVANGGTP
jgi:DNA-binding LacI/PurR family transcriptional regulator